MEKLFELFEVEDYGLRKVRRYKPVSDLFVTGLNLETGELEETKVLEFSVHENTDLVLVKAKDSKGQIEELRVTSDHSLVAYNTKTQKFERVKPSDLLARKELKLAKFKNSKNFELLETLEVQKIADNVTTYDFTTELGTFVVYTNDGGMIPVWDTTAIYSVLTEQSKVQARKKLIIPQFTIHPGKFSTLLLDKDLFAALRWLTLEEPINKKPSKLTYEQVRTYIETKLDKDIEKGIFENKVVEPVEVTIGDYTFVTTFGRGLISLILGVPIESPLSKKHFNRHLANFWFKLVHEPNFKNVPEKDRFELESEYKTRVSLLLKLATRVANLITVSTFDFYKEDLIEELKQWKQKWISEIQEKGILTTSKLQQYQQELKQYLKKALQTFPLANAAAGTKMGNVFGPMLISKGLVKDVYGKVVPVPIIHSYMDGLDNWEFFLMGYGSRKGTTDKTKNVAISGYLLRRLVFSLGYVMVTKNRPDFCGTDKLLKVKITPDELDKFVFRYVKIDGQEVFITFDNLESLISSLKARGIEEFEMEVYSPVYCKAPNFCKKCYPDHYAAFTKLAGIFAAQNVTEDLTQSLLRTFHTGGKAEVSNSLPKALDMLEDTIIAREKLFLDNVQFEEGKLIIEFVTEGSENIERFELEVEDAQIYKTTGEVEPETEIAKVVLPSQDLSFLTKQISNVLSSSEYISPEELYQEYLRPINCQSLYKEVILSGIYFDADTGEYARLYGFRNPVKESIDSIPHKDVMLGLHYQRINESLQTIFSEGQFEYKPHPLIYTIHGLYDELEKLLQD